MTSLVFLLMFLLVGCSAQSLGLELSLERATLSGEEGAACSQLTCRVIGNSASITSVTVSKVKAAGDPSELLAVTTDAPVTDSRAGNVWANGTLQGNSATLRVDLTDVPSCASDVIACEVTFTKRSGQMGHAFTVSGPGKLPGLQLQAAPRGESQSSGTVTETKTETSLSRSGSPFLSELWFLGEKISKVEGKFETLSVRLDRRLSQNVDAVQGRAVALENSVLGRVSSLETDFSSRVSRLEDRLASVLLSDSSDPSEPSDSSESPGTGSGVAQSLADLERRLDDVSEALRLGNQSMSASDGTGHQDTQPLVCERGMGDDVTRTYPRYVVTPDATIERDVLCETQKDGGGWIVLQRRARGDVDFYRDWTAYRDGFGSLSGDFWLGNEAIHTLTDTHPYELRIDFRVKGQELFAEYSSFRIENESDKYRLRLGSYSGTIGEASGKGLSDGNNGPFSTFDRDDSSNCARRHHGAWWYGDCHYSNLNGIWLDKSAKGVCWYPSSSWLYPDYTEIKIRRMRPNTSS